MPYASVSVTNTSVNVIAAAGTPSERVRLTALAIAANAATTVTFQSSTGNVALSGPIPLAANTPFVLPAAPSNPGNGRRRGYLQTAAGDTLNVQLGTANTRIDGFIEYEYVAE